MVGIELTASLVDWTEERYVERRELADWVEAKKRRKWTFSQKRADAALDNFLSWLHYHRRLVPEEDIDAAGDDPKPNHDRPIGFLGMPTKPVVVEEVPAGGGV
uniref:Uncharacterized protein n=1 Tax=Oryza punctata TaxID=4537 RepID=A0A0E0KF22_ORYPU